MTKIIDRFLEITAVLFICFFVHSCNFDEKKGIFSFSLGEDPITTQTEEEITQGNENTPKLVFSNQNLVLTEGYSSSYTLKLESSVSELVQVNFTCSQTYVSCPSSISFDSSDWDIPKTITLTVPTDHIVTGLRTMNIQHTLNYQGKSIPDGTVNLNILDIDSANILLSPTAPSPNIREGTITDSFSIVLTSAPISNVVVSVSFDSTKQISINGDSSGNVQFTFTSLNYNIPQTLLLAAPFDTGLGNRTVSLSFSVTSSDLDYNGFTIPTVIVNVEGNSGGSVGWGSFQSGIQPAGFSLTSITLSTTVNPNKAYVYCSFEYSSSNPNTAATCQLNPLGTQVILQTGGGTNAKVNWYVVEMETGLKVERGSTTFVTGENTKIIPLSGSFALASSFVILYTRTNNTNMSNDSERLVRGSLSTSNVLELRRDKSDTSGTNVTVEWQVIELVGAKVVSGTTSINHLQTYVDVSLSTFNLSKSFLLFNLSGDATVSGYETNYYVRGKFTSPSSIRFRRDGNSGKVQINYFAVELVDASTVQSGADLSVGNTVITVNASLSPSVVTTRSMVIFSSSTVGLIDSYQDSGTFSVLFNSTPLASQVSFTRFNHENHACTIDWFIVEFPP